MCSPPNRANSSYTGVYSLEQLKPVLEAAAPIPGEPIEDEDVGLGRKRSMPRAEAIIRRLEELDGIAGIQLEIKANASASVHANTLHAISAAGGELLQKIGATPDGSTDEVPRKVWNSLRGAAEVYAAHFGSDSRPDVFLRDSIRTIARLVGLANYAIVLELEKARSPENDPFSGDPVDHALRGACRIWTEVLERNVGTTVSPEGAAGGPLIRFCGECLRLIFGDKLEVTTAAALRARIRRLENNGPPKSRGRPRKRRPRESVEMAEI
jgi:hypothetical protein